VGLGLFFLAVAAYWALVMLELTFLGSGPK
jgi:hypothetical protein